MYSMPIYLLECRPTEQSYERRTGVRKRVGVILNTYHSAKASMCLGNALSNTAT